MFIEQTKIIEGIFSVINEIIIAVYNAVISTPGAVLVLLLFGFATALRYATNK